MPDEEASLTFPAKHGKVIGELANGDLLFDDCSAKNGLSLEFVGSGGGKTAAAAVRLAHMPWPYVATDPSAELAGMLCGYLEASGWRIVILNPDREPKVADGSTVAWAKHIGQVNVLDRINICSPLAPMHVDTIINRIFEPAAAEAKQQVDSTTAAFFRDRARDVVTCLTLHTLWAEPIEVIDAPAKQSQWLSLEPLPANDDDPVYRTIDPPPKTLATVSECISLGAERLIEVLAGIKETSPSRRARDLAGRIVGDAKAENMWAGIYADITTATHWLTVEPLAELVSGDTMKVSDITQGNVAVFIQVPLSALGSHARAATVLLGAFFDALIEADGEVPADRVHFEIEEAKLFGRMPELAHLRNYGRKYRASIHVLLQSVAGMEEVWGVLGRREWYENATWRAYSSVRDPIVAKEISEIAGKYPVLDYSDGDNSGTSTAAGTGFGRMSRNRGRNTGVREMARDVFYPWEVTGDLGPDDMLIAGLQKLLLLRRPYYWKRRELIGKVAPSRFYKPAEAAE